VTFTLRRALIAGALSAAALGATAVGPAMADDTAPPTDCATATAQVATATADFVAARAAFVATNKPLGKLMAAERTAARTEARTSRTALGELQQQAAKTHDKAARDALRAQIRSERTNIRHSTRLLESKAALRTQARADREVAKDAFAAARSALESAQSTADTVCAATGSADPVA
jgi:hypothetical protein